ncbi:MAG: helix-turn-helix domain-containing protein [Bacteroidales bacterium]|jgi:transcriptional regulator with XRE-family HTH domain|nr:helix-turn-helix domain-containing protein [Bacteroidales bacterium]
MDNNSIKQNILKIRLEHNMSQTKMADALGIARNTYRKLEKGKTRVISDYIQVIADWAGITPEEVVLGDPSASGVAMLREERERFNDRIRELTESYESQKASLRAEIDNLNRLVSEKEDNNRNLKSIIALLEKRKEDDKND